MSKGYSELCLLETFEERFRYLQTNQAIGNFTFGFERYLNQWFYKTKEWKDARRFVILRDKGNDLGVEGRPINGPIYVHHINPIDVTDIRNHSQVMLDPENLISMSFETHNAIHYGSEEYLETQTFEERKPGDTIPWA